VTHGHGPLLCLQQTTYAHGVPVLPCPRDTGPALPCPAPWGTGPPLRPLPPAHAANMVPDTATALHPCPGACMSSMTMHPTTTSTFQLLHHTHVRCVCSHQY
jgi:hypothetical protein